MAQAITMEPVVSSLTGAAVVTTGAYALTLLLSGRIVGLALGRSADDRIGRVIGKAENVLTITFVLAGAYTGLALIIAAKSIVRRGSDERSAEGWEGTAYRVGGTLVNLAWGLLVGALARVLIFGVNAAPS